MDEKIGEGPAEIVTTPMKQNTKLKKKKKKNKRKKALAKRAVFVDSESARRQRQKEVMIHAASRGVGASLKALGEALDFVNLDGSLVGSAPED
tara:strand:+ start:686 stop:964 length:279 start_codon:yes stop_codon:yes gene_type:complete